MAQLPYMKLWTVDFFSDRNVRRLRDVPGCMTAYLALLALMWMDGGETPDDDVNVALQLQINLSDWLVYRETLMQRGLIYAKASEIDGEMMLHQPRLDRDFGVVQRSVEERDANLKKGRDKANAAKKAKAKKKQEKSAAPQGPVTEAAAAPPATPSDRPSRQRTRVIAEHSHSIAEEDADASSTEQSSETVVAVERGFGGEKNATDKKANTDQALKPKTLSDIANMGLDD